MAVLGYAQNAGGPQSFHVAFVITEASGQGPNTALSRQLTKYIFTSFFTCLNSRKFYHSSVFCQGHMRYNINMYKDFEARLARLGVKQKDVIEKFIRSGGPGGQKINKTSSAVYLKHLSTGIEVKMSRERSQSLNRFLAWRLLTEKLEARILKIKSDRQKRIEKIKRQKRKRSKRAKEKILQQKKMISEKKRSRKLQKTDWS